MGNMRVVKNHAWDRSPQQTQCSHFTNTHRKRARAAPAAATYSSSSGGDGGRRGGRLPSKECGTAAVGDVVYSSGHPAGGGAHTALPLASRGHDHRKPILIFRKRGSHLQQQQQQNHSCITCTDPSTTAAQQYTTGAGWDLLFLTILHLPGERSSRLRERLFMPPIRGVGTRLPLCRREQRGLMCGAGVARACGP